MNQVLNFVFSYGVLIAAIIGCCSLCGSSDSTGYRPYPYTKVEEDPRDKIFRSYYSIM